MTLTTLRTVEPFHRRLQSEGIRLDRRPIETLQVNMGRYCNQACLHCHVEAGPARTEIMAGAVVDRIIQLVRECPSLRTVDITGGAPELNPHFRTLVSEMKILGKTVIDRCNLTVLFEPGQEETARFLADSGVWIIASLPCYSAENVDRQRGSGVFEKSVRALQDLNRLGYGMPGRSLLLDLVYNPGGASLPPSQAELEARYKEMLRTALGIEFNHLYTITNMPIRRFLHSLQRDGELEAYRALLASSFNAKAALGVMCRTLLSVGYDGQLYDCDFNQMLEIPAAGRPRTLWDIESLSTFDEGLIAFDDHCYGCTAGAGSSCGGSLA